jgi:hypothetical protein
VAAIAVQVAAAADTVVTFQVGAPNALGWTPVHIEAWSGRRVWCRFGRLVQRASDFELRLIPPAGRKCSGRRYQVAKVVYGYKTAHGQFAEIAGVSGGHPL